MEVLYYLHLCSGHLLGLVRQHRGALQQSSGSSWQTRQHAANAAGHRDLPCNEHFDLKE